MNAKPSLHVPHPPARPGEKPDFSYLSLSPAGAVPRPGSRRECPGDRIARNQPHPGARRQPSRRWASWNPQALDADTLARRPALHGPHAHLRRPHAQRPAAGAYLVLHEVHRRRGRRRRRAVSRSNRRTCCSPRTACRACSSCRGVGMVSMMCQLLSNTRDMCKGRQLPVMYHSAEKRLFSISGNLATQVPQAVGWAMAVIHQG